jgi:hypothetical protein
VKARAADSQFSAAAISSGHALRTDRDAAGRMSFGYLISSRVSHAGHAVSAAQMSGRTSTAAGRQEAGRGNRRRLARKPSLFLLRDTTTRPITDGSVLPRFLATTDHLTPVARSANSFRSSSGVQRLGIFIARRAPATSAAAIPARIHSSMYEAVSA